MRLINSTALLCALSLCLVAHFASYASAGTLHYTGPMVLPSDPNMTGWWDPNGGGTVWYAGVSESNGDPNAPALPLFGSPASINGNQIDFNPQGFNAQSSGDDSQITDSQLSFMVVAMNGNTIDALKFEEAGDTTLAALSGSAFSSVTMTVFIDVVMIDGSPAPPISTIIANMVFTPSDGDYGVNVPSFPNDGFPNYATTWTGELMVDIDQELVDRNIDFQFGANKLNVTLNNTLTAASSGGGSAFIAKKDFDGFTVTSIIPEPGTATLLLGGLLFGAVRRKRG